MKTVHVVYGDSAAGSLKHYLKTNDSKDEIYAVRDELSVGPLADISQRTSFINKLYQQTAPGEFNEGDCKDIANFHVESWPQAEDFSGKKVVLWHSPNAPEQLTICLAANVLENSDLCEIALTNHRATAEYAPEELGSYLGTEQRMSDQRKTELVQTWQQHVEENTPIRIWNGTAIEGVSETHYDKLLIQSCTDEYQPAARVVGDVLGATDQVVSDTFITHRLHELITQQKIEYRGTLDSLRTFEVRLATS